MEFVPKKYHEFTSMLKEADAVNIVNDGVKHLIDTISNFDLFVDLKSRLNAYEVPLTSVEFEDAILPLITERDWVDSFMGRLLDRRQFTPLFVPQLKSLEEEYFNAIEVFTHPKATLILSVVDHTKIGAAAASETINIMSFTTYLYFIHAKGASIAFYDAVPGATCNKQVIELEDGMLIKVAGTKNSMKFLHAQEDIIVLGVNFFENDIKDCVKVNVEDAKITAKSSGDMLLQRAFMYSTVLRLMQKTDALSCMSGFLKHADPALRWHMMREMLALDLDYATPFLLDMASNDVSGQVKELAHKTVVKFSLNEMA
jgi:hypothetical protein